MRVCSTVLGGLLLAGVSASGVAGDSYNRCGFSNFKYEAFPANTILASGEAAVEGEPNQIRAGITISAVNYINTEIMKTDIENRAAEVREALLASSSIEENHLVETPSVPVRTKFWNSKTSTYSNPVLYVYSQSITIKISVPTEDPGSVYDLILPLSTRFTQKQLSVQSKGKPTAAGELIRKQEEAAGKQGAIKEITVKFEDPIITCSVERQEILKKQAVIQSKLNAVKRACGIISALGANSSAYFLVHLEANCSSNSVTKAQLPYVGDDCLHQQGDSLMSSSSPAPAPKMRYTARKSTATSIARIGVRCHAPESTRVCPGNLTDVRKSLEKTLGISSQSSTAAPQGQPAPVADGLVSIDLHAADDETDS